ncbi:MAG: mechanosensitive ion channel family protein [Acidimicrobiales bacterium]|jgi:small conductance mechanosensitive channel|nr:mechanosensitive ion channel family protein [Acidimicrobiales bacterium]
MTVLATVLAQATTSTTSVSDALAELGDPCGTDPSWACEWVFDATGSEAWAEVADWVLAKPLAILVVLVVAFIANRVLRWLVRRSVGRLADPTRRDRRRRSRTPAVLARSEVWNLRSEARTSTISAVLQSLTTVAVVFVAAVVVLDVVGIALGPLLAAAGILGVALGFGAQTIVRDFLNGFFLVVEDQFGVGDVVDLGPDAIGTVERITLRSTRLRDVNGVVWHVPNGEILRVGNQSQEWARALLDVVVAHDADLEQVKALMAETAHGLAADPPWSDQVLEEPEVWGVEAISREGVTMRLVIKVRPAAQWSVLRELRLRLKAAFDDAGLTDALTGSATPVNFGQVRVEPTSEPPRSGGPPVEPPGEG